VVGVLSPGVHLESPADIWLPLCADPHSVDHIARVRVVARLRAHISIEDARKDVSGGLRAFLQKYPPYSQFGAPSLYREEFTVIPLREAVVGEVRPALYLLMGAVGFVLAISCANTATILLASASRRSREIAVRIAVGAERRHLLSHLLTESLLLSLTALEDSSRNPFGSCTGPGNHQFDLRHRDLGSYPAGIYGSIALRRFSRGRLSIL